MLHVKEDATTGAYSFSTSEIREPVWKLDRLGTAGQLFWRRDSEGIVQRDPRARVKFNYEVQVLEYLPLEAENCVEESIGTLSNISSLLHVLVVGIVCVVATVTTFTWLVR